MEIDEPQRPKPTTGRKRLGCHSYATRSKVKQTLHPGVDCSGSEERQPPLKKRQTRMGAKQGDTSVGIISDDATPDSNAADINTVDENTSAQTALQNDLVLESLFRYMNWSDLLSCRAVNKQWQNETTKELRRRKLIIRFSFYPRGCQKRRNMLFRVVCRRLSECRTPSLLSSFQLKTVARNELGSAGLGSIFTTVGIQMKHLMLHLNYWKKNSTFERSSLMKDLQKLLFRQAPNLEFLEIRFNLPFHWQDELKALYSSDHHRIDSNKFQLLPNLKTFIVSGSPPLHFFEDVMNAAVNLRSFGGVWSTCIKYLMGAEGRAKIHQLKSLQLAVHSTFQWNYMTTRNLERMETFLTEHNKQHLKLETLECVSQFTRNNGSNGPRVVSVMNQILECSAGSLQKLQIDSTKEFEDLLSISRLPRLQEICFDCHWSWCYELGDDGFFPPGFDMNSSLPNVSTIVLRRCSAASIRRFVTRMEGEMTEPVPSVRYIILIDMGNKGNLFPPLATVTDFSHVFPNLVSVSYVESEKYYKI